MISSTTNRVGYTGDGTSAIFAFQYEFHAQADLGVYIWNSARVVATVSQTLNSNYTISGVQDAQNRYTNGANVIFNSTPAIGDLIVIYRDTAPTSPFGLKFNQVIPNAELTKALDRLTIIEQRLKDLGTRSVRLADSYPLTFDPTMPDRLPKNAPLIVSSSGQSISIGVVALTGTTAATYFGILPVPNGGTGVDFSALTGIIYSPGTNTTFDRIQNGQQGYVLTSHGSSAPTFDAFAVNLINSGVLSVAFGGTGTGTSYIQFGVVFASSATQMANSAAGGSDVPLLGNGAAAPGFRALPVNSNSSVTGIMAQSHGGTGTASSFPQYGLIYQQDTSVYGFVPSGSEGQVLSSHGSSIPTFATLVSPNTVKSRTLIYSGSTATLASDQVIFIQDSSATITLHTAVGNQNQILELLHLGSNVVQSYLINTTGGQTVAGQASGSFSMATFGEKLKLISDNVNWVKLDHITRNGRIAYTPSGTFVANTTYKGYWQRDGDEVIVEYHMAFNAAPTSTTLFINLPLTMVVNSSKILNQATQVPAAAGQQTQILGNAICTDSAQAGFHGIVGAVLYSSSAMTVVKPESLDDGGAAVHEYQPITQAFPFAFGAGDSMYGSYRVPIVGWLP